MGIKSCNNHPTVSASIHCSQCHKPICEKCIMNGRFCSTECNNRFSQFYKSFQGKSPQRTTPFMKLLYFVASVAFIAGAAYVILKVLGVNIPIPK